ncbi:hypothetical protein Dimus_031179 [Dionaea muscipula]
MFPSNVANTLQGPFVEYYSSSSLDENPNNSSFILNFPQHLIDVDDEHELLLGHFLHHHQEPPQPAAATSGGREQGAAPSLSKVPEVLISCSTTVNPEKAATSAAAAAACSSSKNKKKRSTSSRQPAGGGAPRRRTGKKDRHSKIYTAQGPRDRRMRLSLQIARKFFDLQDMLGFDKASKTIEWLFTNSKAAIKDLTSSFDVPHTRKNQLMISCRPSASSATSECIAAMEESTHHDSHVKRSGPEVHTAIKRRENNNTNTNTNTTRKGKVSYQHHQHYQHYQHQHSLVRESRDKARARARQRTREKMLEKEIEKRNQISGGDQKYQHTNPSNDHAENNNKDGKLGSTSTTPETTGGGEESAAQDFNSPQPAAGMAVKVVEKCSSLSYSKIHDQDQSLDQHKMASVGIIEKLLGSSSRSLSDIYDYDPHVLPESTASAGMRSTAAADLGFFGFTENWINAENNARISTAAAGYGDPHIISSEPHQEQNPNPFFMASTHSGGSIYLLPHQEFFSRSGHSLDPSDNHSFL